MHTRKCDESLKIMIEKSEEEMSDKPNQQSQSNKEDLSPLSRGQTCNNLQKTTNNVKTNQNNCSYLTPHYSHSFHFDCSPISSIRETSRLPLWSTSKDSVNTSDAQSPESFYFPTGSVAVLFGEGFEWETLEVTSDNDCSGSQKVVMERIENKNVSDCSSRCRFGSSCCSTWSVFSFVATMASFVACVVIVYIDFATNCRICPGHEALYLSVPALVLSAFVVVLKWNLCDVLLRRVIKARYDHKVNMAVIFLQHLFGLAILCQASLCWPYKFFASSIVLMCFLQVIFEQLNQEAKSFI